MSLRTHTIRLAYTHAHLKPHLLPLLRDAGMSRTALKVKEMERLLDKGEHFAVLTPYGGSQKRSKAENKKRFSEFVRDLQAMGYGGDFETLKGEWEGVRENSVIVKGMSFDDAYKLGRKYEQDAIVYKDKSGTLGIYYTKDNTAEVAVKPTGEMAAEVSEQPKLYSKSRGMSFEFGVLWGEKVPWDGSRPITRKQLKTYLDEGAVDPGGERKKGPTFNDFLKSQGEKKVKSPETGNDVQISSLRGPKGLALQKKLYESWKGEAAA